MDLKQVVPSLLFALCVLCGHLRVTAAPPRGIIPESGHEVKTLSQNWTDAEASWFYNAAQGSYLLRYEWFINLEQADSEKLFRDASHFQSLGYLARGSNSENPDGLAIGFVRDEKEFENGVTESYLGMTCAACHTGHVNYGGKTFIIDGAPTNGNFEKLQRGLVAAIEATLNNAQSLIGSLRRLLELPLQATTRRSSNLDFRGLFLIAKLTTNETCRKMAPLPLDMDESTRSVPS